MQNGNRLRHMLLSAAVFCVLLLGVASVNPRIGERMGGFITGGGLAAFDDHATDVGHALIAAARNQSRDNAPLMIFAGVGAILFVFMFRT